MSQHHAEQFQGFDPFKLDLHHRSNHNQQWSEQNHSGPEGLDQLASLAMDATAELVRPVEVEARGQYRLWLRFSDGVEGEVDVSDLAGQGVFAAWQETAFFDSVRIDETRAVSWGDAIDLCPDALYLRLTGMAPEHYLPVS